MYNIKHWGLGSIDLLFRKYKLKIEIGVLNSHMSLFILCIL